MSDRGRGRGRGRGGSGDRGRGSFDGGRGGSGDRGRGSFDGGRGGGRGGGGYRGGYQGGPPNPGQSTQMAVRGTPRGGRGGRGGGGGGGDDGPGIYLLGTAAPPAPDANITAAENALIPITRGREFEFTGTKKVKDNKPIQFTVKMPGRRGYGTEGTQIVLRANYFRLNTAYEKTVPDLQDKTLYRYEVELAPEPSAPKRRRGFEELLRGPLFRGKVCATDYANIIVTTEELDLGKTPKWIRKILIPAEEGNIGAAGGAGPPPEHVQAARLRNTVEFRIHLEGRYSLGYLIDYLRSTVPGAEYPGQDSLIQILNIIMCKRPQEHAGIRRAGHNKFYPITEDAGLEYTELGSALQAIRGYFSSVRPAVNRLLVNINVTSAAFYKALPLRDLLRESGIPAETKDQAEAFIRLLKVRAVYVRDGEREPYMVKIKTICGFAHPPEPKKGGKPKKPETAEDIELLVTPFGNANQIKFRFTDRSGATPQERITSVNAYFRNERGITLAQPGLPVLNVGTPNDPQYIPMEICTVIPGQPYRRMLTGQETSNMITFAARRPDLNAMSIAGTPNARGNGLKTFGLASDRGEDVQRQFVKQFGFSVTQEMITVPGRRLAAPAIRYGRNATVTPERGSWNFSGKSFVKPGRFARWQVLVINGPRGSALPPQSDPEGLFKDFGIALKQYGLEMGDRMKTQTIQLESLTPDKRQNNDMRIIGAFENAEALKVPILLVVLPQQDRWLYARIKFHGDVKFGIHTINAIGNKLQKTQGQGMFFGNLALKFNIKGGGISHTVPDTFTAPLSKNTMLMGIDVTHPSPGSNAHAPSIACVVASTDEHLCQWPGSVRTQTGGQEMVNGLTEMVQERLKLWQKKQGGYPDKIIIYRDGVSEGQYPQVLDIELPAIQHAFKGMYGVEANWPKLAIIIVGKRHHTRFFPTKEQDADLRSKNPLPGTVVDRGVTGKLLSEYFLQAHQGLQGTARPAHYVVIKDDIGMEADLLQKFTHKLCYLFNRASKAVSICPPAYYADLLCERGRAYLFSVLAENSLSNNATRGAGNNAPPPLEWTRDPALNLRESTWYI